MITVLILLSLFISSDGHPDRDISPSPDCAGFMFLGEDSLPTCLQYGLLWKLVYSTVEPYLYNRNAYALRGYGRGDEWVQLAFMDKSNFLNTTRAWINAYGNGRCEGELEQVNYINPFTDILNNLNSGYGRYGIFLMGETDSLVDVDFAMDLAQKIADANTSVYVWDVSINNNNNSLFETLTGGKPNHIITGANLTNTTVFQFLTTYMVPDFQSFSCGGPNVTIPPTKNPATVPPTQPSTNTSCASLELIFILDRSQSIIPYIYNNNVTQFVVDFASQFSFPEESSNKNDFIRLGLIQFADTSEVSIPLGNYSRNNFADLVRNKVQIGDGGTNNLVNALFSAYNQFQSNSIFSNRAVILVLDDVSLESIDDALDAMSRLETLVTFPMGAIVPGFSGTPEEGLSHLKILLKNQSKLAFPDLNTALRNGPELISGTFPCQRPPICSVLVFIEEATVVIGADAKLSFLRLIQRLVNTVSFNPNQRFSISFYGESIYKSIEPQFLEEFNLTLSAFIETISSDNSPNGGKTFLAPILNQLIDTIQSSLYGKFSVLLLGEVETLRDPTSAFTACTAISKLNPDFYVIDRSRFTGPSSLFSTCVGNKERHVLNGTSLSQDQLFENLRDSLIKNFNMDTC